jgi:hypothetical protein
MHPTAVAIRRTLFEAHNPVAVAELEHSVHGMDTTADHATSSSPSAGKCDDDGPITWYYIRGSFYGMQNIFQISILVNPCLPGFVMLGCI